METVTENNIVGRQLGQIITYFSLFPNLLNIFSIRTRYAHTGFIYLIGVSDELLTTLNHLSDLITNRTLHFEQKKQVWLLLSPKQHRLLRYATITGRSVPDRGIKTSWSTFQTNWLGPMKTFQPTGPYSVQILGISFINDLVRYRNCSVKRNDITVRYTDWSLSTNNRNENSKTQVKCLILNL